VNNKKKMTTLSRKMATLRSAPQADLSRILHKAKREKTRAAHLRDPNRAFDDFLSAFLLKRDRAWLLGCCKLLLVVMHRMYDISTVKTEHPQVYGVLQQRPDLAPLLCFDYSTEYYEQLSASYLCVPLAADDPVAKTTQEPWLPLQHYFTALYHLSKKQPHSPHLLLLLRGFLIVLLCYDVRVRRFVMGRHDVHYKHLSTCPPCSRKTTHFIAACRPWVDRFLRVPEEFSLQALAQHAIALWIDQYMLEK
jgi:hypothetical protein